MSEKKKRFWLEKIFYLFINYNVVTFKEHPLCLHTPLPAVLPLLVAFLARNLWEVVEGLCYSLLDVLLPQNGVFHCRFYLLK